jgi:hypothetical protein
MEKMTVMNITAAIVIVAGLFFIFKNIPSHQNEYVIAVNDNGLSINLKI